MFKNLLTRDGIITTRSFFNPCCGIRSIFEEEFIFQSGQQINKYHQHEDLDLFISRSSFGEGSQESWVVAEEEQQLEPEIAEFLACLIPEEEYKLRLEIKDTKEGSQENQESIKSWTESVFQLHPFNFQQL